MGHELTERRAADRKIIAQMIIDTATANGCTATQRPAPIGLREIWIIVEAPGGAHVTIDLDGDSTQPNVHVWTWNIHHDSEARFGNGWGHDAVNPFHRRKATHVTHGITETLSIMAADCRGLVDGSRYENKES